MTDHCKLITAHPEDFERMINALETSLHACQKEIERQAGVIVHDSAVYGQIIKGNERRIAELEESLRRAMNWTCIDSGEKCSRFTRGAP